MSIAAPNAGKIGEDVIVGSGKTAERENVLKPEYGKIVGGIEEIDLLLPPRSSITQTIEPETLLVI